MARSLYEMTSEVRPNYDSRGLSQVMLGKLSTNDGDTDHDSTITYMLNHQKNPISGSLLKTLSANKDIMSDFEKEAKSYADSAEKYSLLSKSAASSGDMKAAEKHKNLAIEATKNANRIASEEPGNPNISEYIDRAIAATQSISPYENMTDTATATATANANANATKKTEKHTKTHYNYPSWVMGFIFILIVICIIVAITHESSKRVIPPPQPMFSAV
jgi:hypothetical protein